MICNPVVKPAQLFSPAMLIFNDMLMILDSGTQYREYEQLDHSAVQPGAISFCSLLPANSQISVLTDQKIMLNVTCAERNVLT